MRASLLLALLAGAPALADETRGIHVVTDENGSRLEVDGKPLMLRGMNWDYFPVDTNYTYSLWERPEPEIQRALDNEMALLKAMHVNVIRVYAGMPSKWIRYVFEKFGIYTVLNHTLGRYGMSIDGVWVPVLDYSDRRTREVIRNEVGTLVDGFKDTPGLLMWLLGNENNYGLEWESAAIANLPLAQKQDARAEALYSLFGEVIGDLKQKDPAHPVAMANGDLQFIDLIAKHCQGLDVMGANVYRGRSAGTLFQVVKEKLGVPFVFTEFGADAYNTREQREDELTQASVLRDQWREIDLQSSGKGLAGNSIGGFTFQWSDGWWKYLQDARLDVHDTTAAWANGGYREDYVEGENNMNEEWWGIMAKDPSAPGEVIPLHPRAAYFVLQRGFSLDPYGEGVTAAQLQQHWDAIDLRAAAREAAADRNIGVSSALQTLQQMVHLTDTAVEISTFTTGGIRLNDPLRATTRFDHTQSVFLGVEVQPTASIRGKVIMNFLGNVATNPIDEIYFERRGPLTLKIYQAELEWNEAWFDVTGFFRKGHYHWGYEGDFFALYPEANYQPAVDQYNVDAPNGVVFTGHKALEGLKIAFGEQLYWGANPSVIGKYDRKFGSVELALMHQQDIAQRASVAASAALPVPQTAKTTLYAGWKSGGWKLEAGGIIAGYDRVGRSFTNAVVAPPSQPSYFNSGYWILDDTVRWYDTLGAKAKVTWSGGIASFYAQGGYRGLVADSLTDQTITLAGFRLKESGQGNHAHGIAGAVFQLGPSFQLAPNVLYQKPLVAPLPALGDVYDPKGGNYYAGAVPRNQLTDPFWVRSNREMLAAELLLVFDPTPASWFFAWDNAQKENAPFAASLDVIYKHLPTRQDAGLGVLGSGQVFAFPNSVPARDLIEVWARFVANAGGMHLAGALWGGTAQANGDSNRVVTRAGIEARLDYSRLVITGAFKLNDFGPYDYHRDFDLTFRVQSMLDIAWTATAPRWFVPVQTKIGIAGKYRVLDVNSNRYDLTQAIVGNEWEVKTYVRFSL
ncbi:MAG: hypothetical protein Q8L48_06085 [Archangium sp.]|nr:hypothetical protein [Archangium sp.]